MHCARSRQTRPARYQPRFSVYNEACISPALSKPWKGRTVFVRPELVVEIAFSDIQESPRYPAGLALRFARVKRYRPDKSASEADTIQTVSELFRTQRA